MHHELSLQAGEDHAFADATRHRVAAPAVLVVDDVRATRAGLAELLRLRRFHVYEAENGAEALHVLRHHPHICVVVLDLWMPGTDGFWFRAEQLRDPMLAHVPVVVFTGSARDRDLAELKAADVLLKPLSVDKLLDAISRHCGSTADDTGRDPL